MKVQIELTVPCSVLEEMLHAQYHLDEPVELVKIEHDEYSDLCVFAFEVEEDVAGQIDRHWDDTSFAGDILEEAI
jgi:hypothetical protein